MSIMRIPLLSAAVSLFLTLPAVAADTSSRAVSRLLPIIPHAYAGSSINVGANTRSSLFTQGTTQFAAFYDADEFLVLAKRTLGADTWETRRTDFRADVADAHNFVSIAIDGDGFLHVAWDHHNNPLNYARSVAPLSLELGPKMPMTGEREQRVTYPQFHRLPDGDLLFLYRDGESGNGSLVLKRYDTAARKWSVVQSNLIDGEGERSPYWDLTVDRAGTLHLGWVWRDSPDVATNHDLAYARSADGGVTWTQSDGTPLALPITAATAEYAQRIPTHRNLMNPPSIAADARGRPYLCTYWSPQDNAPPQFQIVQRVDSGWRVVPGPVSETPFTLAGTGTKHPPISRAALLVDNTWNRRGVYLIYRDDAREQRILLASQIDFGTGPWETRELHAAQVGAWEPSFDPVLWDRFSQAHLLVQRAAQRDGDDKRPADVEPSTIADLLWTPLTARMRSEPTSAPAAATSEEAQPDRTPLAADAVLALAQRAVDWQWAHFPSETVRHPRDWTMAPFYIGVLALDRVSPDHHNREKMRAFADDVLQWQPHKRIYHADDHAVIQAYLELHHAYHDERMLAPSKQRFDEILAHPSQASLDWNTPHCADRWSWCDALFMAPPAWLALWRETGDRRYLDFMNREWWATTEHLYRPDAGFFFRDDSYRDLREPNGRTIHWSRGNGWVFAGLARVLELFPKDHPDYARYVKLYREMADAVLASQQPDGLWRPGLLDPIAHPAPETSGSGFFVYGLAWGVNHDLLDSAGALPSIQRGWNALARCVTPEGKLEHVQPIGHGPEGFDPHHTDAFAVGAFLLAASEVSQLAK